MAYSMEIVKIVEIIWKDMVATPWGACLGLGVLFLILFRDSIKSGIDLLLKRSSDAHFKKETFTESDVANHPIFRDLRYWLEKGVNLVKIERSYAKELIMKDVLTIKFNVIQDLLNIFIKNLDFKTLTLIELKTRVHNLIRDINSQKVLSWRNSGIPEIFIKKYLAVDQLSTEFMYSTVKVFLSNEVDTDLCTRVYVILSILETNLASIYANAVSTALSLNGDLNGTVYKGVIIGAKHEKYAVPNPSNKEAIEAKLEDLLIKCDATRVAVLLFHDYPGYNAFSGKFSSVYEKCAPGIESAIDRLQYIPAYTISNCEKAFQKDEVFIGDCSKVNYSFKELLVQQGTEVVAMYPLKDEITINGFISVSWAFGEKYKDLIEHTSIQEVLKESAKSINNLILGQE